VTALAVPVLVDDKSIWPAITSLVSCLCEQVITSGLPPVCICTPLPGETLATDYVSEEAGMAWVRLESAWPSTSFPNPSASAACNAPLAFGLEVGLAYCAPTLQEDGTPPAFAEQFNTTRVQLAAMAAIRRAVICCFPATRAQDVILGLYVPMGPEGGVVGGSWSISVAEGAI
jgi:hypothetical protein